MRLRRWLSRERGQSLVVVALMLVVLVGALGLVIDVGNLYAERRFMQNAADAAALAGARELALDEPVSTVEAAIEKFAIDENGAETVESEVLTETVAVTVTKVVPTYFMGVMGIETNTVGARAQAGYCPLGKPEGIMPFGVEEQYVEFGINTVIWDSTAAVDPKDLPPGFAYPTDNLIVPPHRGWINLLNDKTPNASDLAEMIDESGFDGVVELGDYVGSNGSMASALGVLNEWTGSYIPDDTNRDDPRLDVIVPVYDSYVQDASRATFHISGFASFHIYAVVKVKEYRYIYGQFQPYADVQPQTRCGTKDYGARIVQLER